LTTRCYSVEHLVAIMWSLASCGEIAYGLSCSATTAVNLKMNQRFQTEQVVRWSSLHQCCYQCQAQPRRVPHIDAKPRLTKSFSATPLLSPTILPSPPHGFDCLCAFSQSWSIPVWRSAKDTSNRLRVPAAMQQQAHPQTFPVIAPTLGCPIFEVHVHCLTSI
jgi:hypothetical protein